MPTATAGDLARAPFGIPAAQSRAAGLPANPNFIRSAPVNEMGTLLELPVTTAVRSWSDLAEVYRRPTAVPARRRSVRRPTVSVCIVANQPSRRMQSMIDSILAQRFRDLEIVVVGNATLYVKRAMLARPADERLRIIRTEFQLSLSDSYNLAVRHSRGRFVKLLSPDAALHPDLIAAQVNVLESNRGVALVVAGTDYLDEAGEVVRRQQPLFRTGGHSSARGVVKAIVRSGDNPVGPLTAAMFRRTDFRRCGAFSQEHKATPELDLWMRLLRFGDFYYLPAPASAVCDSHVAVIGRNGLRRRLAEWSTFTRRVADDGTWDVSAFDRLVGYVRCCITVVRSDRAKHCNGCRTIPPNRASTLNKIGEQGNVTSIVGR